MAAPDPLRGTDEEFAGIHWRQMVGAMEPAGDNSFSKTHGEGSIVGLVDERKTRGALRFALGFDAVQPAVGTPGDPLFLPALLLRTNPVPHPKYPDLFCTVASELGLAPDGQGALRTTKVFGRASAPAGFNRLGGGPTGVRAKYRESRIALRFEPLAHDLLTDADVLVGTSGLEHRRNVVWDQEPRTEILSLSGLTLTYAEGSGLPIATHSSPAGQSVAAEVGQVLVKSDCRATWYGVPERWLYRSGTKRPTRMLARLGTVNDAEFFGYARGTLMFSGVKLTRHPWALHVAPLVPTDAAESRHHYDCELLFSWFDPDRGFDGNPATALATSAPARAGWNCLPWRGALARPFPFVFGSDGNAGKWFFATYDGNVAGKTMFSYTDFTKCFDAAENAAADGV